MNSLKNKTAIITGASRGIGRATTVKFAEEGCNVVINYNKNEKEAKMTQSKLSKKVKSIIVKADVSKSDDCKKLIEKSVSEFKKIDVLVNNAGANPQTELLKTEESTFDEIFNLIVKGTFFCTKYAVPYMNENGRIINLSSVRAFKSRFPMSVYGAAKSAVSSLTMSLANELASRKISVNAVAPGYTETGMMLSLPKNLREELIKSVPLKRFAKPEEIAELILFLASSKSDYLTGQTISIDGGYLT